MEVWSYRLKRFILGFCACSIVLTTNAQVSSNSSIAATTAVTHAVVPLRSDLDDEHRIRPGDKLSFRVEEDREEPKLLPVTDSGEVELPYNFGRLIAANKTCKALAQEIK